LQLGGKGVAIVGRVQGQGPDRTPAGDVDQLCRHESAV
jgi:hypothetical protein